MDFGRSRHTQRLKEKIEVAAVLLIPLQMDEYIR
jgi:hypothetical protein